MVLFSPTRSCSSYIELTAAVVATTTATCASSLSRRDDKLDSGCRSKITTVSGDGEARVGDVDGGEKKSHFNTHSFLAVSFCIKI